MEGSETENAHIKLGPCPRNSVIRAIRGTETKVNTRKFRRVEWKE